MKSAFNVHASSMATHGQISRAFRLTGDLWLAPRVIGWSVAPSVSSNCGLTNLRSCAKASQTTRQEVIFCHGKTHASQHAEKSTIWKDSVVRFRSNAVVRSNSGLLSQAIATCMMSDLDQNSLITFRGCSTLAHHVQDVLRLR